MSWKNEHNGKATVAAASLQNRAPAARTKDSSQSKGTSMCKRLQIVINAASSWARPTRLATASTCTGWQAKNRLARNDSRTEKPLRSGTKGPRMRCLGHAGRHSIDASRWQYALSLLHHWSGSFASERQRGQRSITFVTLLRFQREAPKIMLKQGIPWLWRVDVWILNDCVHIVKKCQKQTRLAGHSLVEKAQSTGLNWPWLKSVHVIIGWWLLCQPRLMKTTQATVPAIPPRNASFPKFFQVCLVCLTMPPVKLLPNSWSVHQLQLQLQHAA